MKRAIYLGVCSMLALAASCADEPSDEKAGQSTTGSFSGAGTTTNVEARCEEWVDLFCARYGTCLVQEGEIEQAEFTPFVRECGPRLIDTLSCSEAVQIRSTYAACVRDLEAIDCAVLIEEDSDLPPNCKGLILVP